MHHCPVTADPTILARLLFLNQPGQYRLPSEHSQLFSHGKLLPDGIIHTLGNLSSFPFLSRWIQLILLPDIDVKVNKVKDPTPSSLDLILFALATIFLPFFPRSAIHPYIFDSRIVCLNPWQPKNAVATLAATRTPDSPSYNSPTVPCDAIPVCSTTF